MQHNPELNNDSRQKASFLGVGLDKKDEHVRITKGDNFNLVGGSEETHGRMVETAMRFNEKLEDRGKNLDEVEPNEFKDLMGESIEESR